MRTREAPWPSQVTGVPLPLSAAVSYEHLVAAFLVRLISPRKSRPWSSLPACGMARSRPLDWSPNQLAKLSFHRRQTSLKRPIFILRLLHPKTPLVCHPCTNGSPEPQFRWEASGRSVSCEVNQLSLFHQHETLPKWSDREDKGEGTSCHSWHLSLMS
jgi:hypothetical protein